MKNKKGLSMIVTSLIIILLVIVAMGILYAVYINFVRSGVGDFDISTKCMNVDVGASMVDCSNPAACVVTLKRTAGGDDIAGVKLVFKNETGSSSSVLDYTGNIEPLGTVTLASTYDSGIVAPNKLEVTVYFEDESKNEQLCSTTNTKEF